MNTENSFQAKVTVRTGLAAFRKMLNGVYDCEIIYHVIITDIPDYKFEY